MPGPPLAWHCYGVTEPAALAQDALLNLLLPAWQIAIGLCVLAAVIVVGFRLAKRGPSRVTTALVITGGAILAICAIGMLAERI